MKNRINKIQNALKQIKPQKIGAVITVLLFGLICAIGGYELNSATGGSSSVLPIAKGGTGNNIGNAPTADKLYTSRNINDMPFDGSQDINLPGASSVIVNSNNAGNAYLKFNPLVDNTYSNTNYRLTLSGCALSSVCFDSVFAAKDIISSIISRKSLYLRVYDASTPNDILTYGTVTINNVADLYFKVKNMGNGRKIKWSSDIPQAQLTLVTNSADISTLDTSQFYYFDVTRAAAASAAPK
ncbi:MAG: hypothetical protein LBB10_00205 [Bifidobacteriaceae bacterium]|jgi:hypothetical protein|nr:hypothetical protein [Bifidobacteriaceae bacterium]